MDKIRVRYEKRGRARYISHLDLYRFMQRVMRRAKLSVHYTEGFNPHQYLVFALPLSLGFSSTCESLEFALDESVAPDEVVRRLNLALPEGIRALSASEPVCKLADIASAVFRVTLKTDDAAGLLAAVERLMAADEILCEKKNKKKQMVTFDLRPSILRCETTPASDGVTLTLQLPAGTQTNVNPTLFLQALAAVAGTPEFSVAEVCRTEILCADGKDFL